MSAVFISYRRKDSEQFSARLHEALDKKLGQDEVFLDVENIDVAADWKLRLQTAISAASLIVVVIGPAWMEEIQKRIETEDQVVWEIKTAIALGKTIVPLLISGAAMPDPQVLPEEICLLSKYNALTLASPKSEDFEKILTQICSVLSHIQPLREDKPASGLRRFLDPLIDMLERYPDQPQILAVKNEAGDSYRIPVVTVLNANDGRDEEQMEVELKNEFFKAKIGSRQAFEEYKADAIHRGKSFYDTETARLADVIGGEKIKFIFQPTSYFEYVKTNMAMDFDDVVGGTLRDEVHRDGKLEALSKSKLANHTGISGLVFSNDGHMIFQRRSSKVLTNPNQLCPGFSGAMTEDDIRRSFSGRDTRGVMQDVHVFRELTEELGIRKHSVTQRCFMGLSRELLRGGKPELFYAVDIDMSAREILECFPKEREGETFFMPLRYATARLDEDEASYYRQRFEKIIQEMEIKAGARASLPLLTNLAFWVNQHQPPLMRHA